MSKNTQLGNLVNGIYVDASGNVGIGTSAPSSKLHLVGTLRINNPSVSGQYMELYTSSGISYYNSQNNSAFYTAFQHIFNTDGTSATERMRINSDGTMLLGGTSTSGTAGTGSGRGNLILGGSTSNKITFNNNSTTINGFIYSDSSEFNLTGSGFMVFNAGGSERMRITSGGNVLIGTTTDNGYKLNVSGSIYASSSIVSNGSMYAVGGLGSQGGIYIDYGYAYGMNSNTQNAANAWNFYVSSSFSNNIRFFYGGSGVGTGTAKAQIDTSGNYSALSDFNKKKDIALSTLGLAEVMQLKPSTFKFKDDENQIEQIGFIAQEVKDIIPQAYYEDAEGDDKFIGLKQTAFIPVLVKAIQELKAEIETLKQK